MAVVGREVVASLGDCLVREEDMLLLRPGQWLNDQLIGIIFELSEQETFAGADIAFVGPEVTQFMKVSPTTELASCLEPLGLSSKRAVMWALNNCASLDAPGGSHWSLLVFVRQYQTFYHLDSSAGMNSLVAKDMARRATKLVGGGEEQATFVELKVEQQTNGHDCGVFLLLNAFRVGDALKNHNGDIASSLPPLSQKQICDGRASLEATINSIGRR